MLNQNYMINYQIIINDTDGKIGKVGYEINFNRVFFKYEPPRSLQEIDAELSQVENNILEILKGMSV